jgi:hypothetical protein
MGMILTYLHGNSGLVHLLSLVLQNKENTPLSSNQLLLCNGVL